MELEFATRPQADTALGKLHSQPVTPAAARWRRKMQTEVNEKLSNKELVHVLYSHNFIEIVELILLSRSREPLNTTHKSVSV